MNQNCLCDEFQPQTMSQTEPILAELVHRGAERKGHGRGTILGHLKGTHDVLVAWRQPERLRLAGLLHNAYSTEAFNHALFDLSERDTIRAMIGDESERLVHIFGGINRGALFDQLEAFGGAVAEPFRLIDRRGDELELNRRDVGDLLVLYLANVADQACMTDGGPTLWLASVSKLLGWVVRNAEVVPQILDDCTADISQEADETALEAYDTALRTLASDRSFAMNRLEAAARHLPWVAEPALWLGYLSFVDGDTALARTCVTQASTLFGIWGTAWDKRLTMPQWQSTLFTLEALTKCQPTDGTVKAVAAAMTTMTCSPWDFYLALKDANLLRHPAGQTDDWNQSVLSAKLDALPMRFRTYLARHTSSSDQPMGIGIYPGLTARPWHDPQTFPIARALEEASPEIAREFAELSAEMFSDEAEEIARTGRWSVVFLEKDGVRVDDVCDQCPVTAAVLERHRVEIQGAGVSYFSCLDPGTRVAPHRGPTNTRLRLHLGLEIPENCGLRVAGTERNWTPGRCVVFDDSFVHNVWNESTRRRVVMIVDIWHPDLTTEEIALLQWMSS